MSFIVTVYVREGIVMTSDSRLTLNATQQLQQQQVVQLAVGQSDSNYKTFLATNKLGISTCGEASINNVPIGGYVESFINEHLPQGNYEVDQVPQELLSYFRNFTPIPNITFHVGGYKKVDNVYQQHVWNVQIQQNTCQRINDGTNQGVSRGGEGDILARIIKPTFSQDSQGNYQPFSNHPIPYQFFTLQDAIDFSIYAIRTTIDTIRFQPRPKSVGGPIDVLVIKPEEVKWVQRKELKGNST